MNIWTGKFWKATVERVISSVAGGALATLGAGAVSVVAVDWADVASIAAGAGIVSLLKALITNSATGNGPAIGSAEVLKSPGKHASGPEPAQDDDEGDDATVDDAADIPAGDVLAEAEDAWYDNEPRDAQGRFTDA